KFTLNDGRPALQDRRTRRPLPARTGVSHPGQPPNHEPEHRLRIQPPPGRSRAATTDAPRPFSRLENAMNSFLSRRPVRPHDHRARLRLQALEDRLAPATLYIDNPAAGNAIAAGFSGDFQVTNDQGAIGTLDSGDTVTWSPGAGSAHGTAVTG